MNITIIILGILFILAGAALLAVLNVLQRRDYDEKQHHNWDNIPIPVPKPLIWPAFVIALGAACIILANCFTIVPTGYTGVRTTFGLIDQESCMPGFNTLAPFVQKISLVNNKQQDVKITDRIWSETKEQTVVYMENTVVTYRIVPESSAWIYTKTEELIFAMSLFPDAEQAFAQFRGQLVNLLGKGRTIPVYGNTDIFNYAFTMLNSLKPQMKGKNMDVLRALSALPVSFVKEGSKPYDRLLENGYEPIEIAFLNTDALYSRCVPGGPEANSLTAEKVVVSLFRAVIAHDKALPDVAYEYLSRIYPQYKVFTIKCYGERELVDVLSDGLQIQTPETMAWFIRCTDIVQHPATGSFDVMDTKWDSMAESLDPEIYLRLFEGCLTTNMDTVQIQKRLTRHQELTHRNYLDCYSMKGLGDLFSLMVDKGIVDLWTAFQSCIAKDGGVRDYTLLQHIKGYCRGIRTVQAFEFMRRFMELYGFQGRERYFNQYRDGFENELWNKKSYFQEITLSLRRAFLEGKPEQLLFLHWLDEYFFTKKPDRYLDFLTAVLKDKDASAMLAPEDLRKVFDVIITQPKLPAYDATELKQRYLTPEELQADQDARKAAKEERNRLEHLKLVQIIEDRFSSMYDGKVETVAKFLDETSFYDDREKIARRVVSDELDRILKDNGYALDTKEMGCFLRICGDLVEGNALTWKKFQSYISLIKEEINHEPDQE